MGEVMKITEFLAVALVSIMAVLPPAVFAQPGSSGRSDGLQFSDFAVSADMRQAEARNLNALVSKWTGKYCVPMYAGCAVPVQDASDELAADLQKASTMPQLNAWRQKTACVDRCVMDFAPPAPDQARAGCMAGCSVGGSPSK
jgi:hypothetical protein